MPQPRAHASTGPFQHTLFERLSAFVRLLERREDLSFKTPLTTTRAEQPTLPLPYPADAAAFAASATRVSFSCRGNVGAPFEAGLHLVLEGVGDAGDVAWDDGIATSYDLEVDAEGRGEAAWLRFDGQTAFIQWSLEKRVRFGSLTEYLTEGAGAGFCAFWQKSRDDGRFLLDASLPVTTPTAAIRELLLPQVGETMADDLIAWLGERIVVLFALASDDVRRRLPSWNLESTTALDRKAILLKADAQAPLSSSELGALFAAHEAFLEEGVGSWKWTSESGLPKCEFDGDGEPGLDVRYRHLEPETSFADQQEIPFANFAGCICTSADFTDTNLDRALFVGGIFDGSDFSGADLSKVDFTDASLRGCKFADARLGRANFERADLTGADFGKADTSRARFAGAILTDVKAIPR